MAPDTTQSNHDGLSPDHEGSPSSSNGMEEPEGPDFDLNSAMVPRFEVAEGGSSELM